MTANGDRTQPVTEVLATLGRRVGDVFRYLGGLSLLFADGIWWATLGPLKGKGSIRREETFFQARRMGIRSLGIVSLVIFFVGMILAFQTAYVLRIFGLVEYVADMIGIAMIREMGPLIVGMVMTGFTGAAIAAEIGTMVVSEEVTALEAGALNPVRFLVVPRLLASMAMMPIVCLFASYMGVFGGFTVAYVFLGLDPTQFFNRAVEALVYRDIFTGLCKSEAFGILITLIACYEGLQVTGGAEGVGRATTSAVVRSIIAIIVCDLIFTAVFFFV